MAKTCTAITKKIPHNKCKNFKMKGKDFCWKHTNAHFSRMRLLMVSMFVVVVVTVLVVGVSSKESINPKNSNEDELANNCDVDCMYILQSQFSLYIKNFIHILTIVLKRIM